MSKPSEPTAAILPAASVVIIRDGKPQSAGGGLEVFMLERNRGTGMAFSGASVFPGGKVDVEDRAAAWSTLASATPPVPDSGFWIAAVRETFEEAGLMFARKHNAARLIGSADAHRLATAERIAPRLGRSARFAETIAREQLLVATDHLIYFGHWITPTWAPKRFDTHFFLAAAPDEQRENLDRDESADGVWIRPAAALQQADAGKRTLVAVTRCTLELLATWPTVTAAVNAARLREVVTVQPYMEETATGRVLRIPPEAGYVRSVLPVEPAKR